MEKTLTLKRLHEAYHQVQLSLLVTFVRFSKAFASVDRNALFKIIRHYGTPRKIIDVITMYTNRPSQILFSNQFNKAFCFTTGAHQEHTLSPFLFIIVVDYFVQQTDNSLDLEIHVENPEENIPDLNFADNIVVLDEDEITAIEHYDILQNIASQTGLRINKDRTKIIHINYRRESAAPKALERLEVLKDFKYLGVR